MTVTVAARAYSWGACRPRRARRQAAGLTDEWCAATILDMERKRNHLTPFPTVRLGDALRVTAIVTVECQICGHVESLDVIRLACTDGPAESVQAAVRRLSCAACGERGAGVSDSAQQSSRIRGRTWGGQPQSSRPT